MQMVDSLPVHKSDTNTVADTDRWRTASSLVLICGKVKYNNKILVV